MQTPTHQFLLALAQPGATAGAAPASPQPVNAVGVPGATPTVQGGDASQGSATPPQAQGPLGGNMLFWMLPVLLLFMFLMQAMTGRKEKKRREELANMIKKGERVRTVGGVVGTIAEVGDQDVVLRLEEGKMRIAKSAIQSVESKDRPQANGTIESKPEGAKAPV